MASFDCFNNEFNFSKIIQDSSIGNGQPVEITPSSHGKSNFCFFANIREKQYIFKFPRTRFSADTIMYEKTVTNYLRDLISVEIPRILIEWDDNRPYTVYQAITGVNMSDADLNDSEQHLLSAELANFMTNIHSINHHEIPFDIHRKRDSIELFCEDFNYFPNFDSVEDLLEEDTLIHGDFHRSNVLLNSSKHLCGVLDFATFSTGSIYFDLGQMVFSMTKSFNNTFIDAYEKATSNKVDLDKLQRVVSFLDDMINKHYLPFIWRNRYV